MADKTSKIAENIAGPWYVDTTCTPCRTCMEVTGADDLLKYNDDETYVYFYKQPSSPEEVAVAEETLAVCPQNAIGSDGD